METSTTPTSIVNFSINTVAITSETLVETLTEIVSNLNWRHQTIGNIIKWKQFESGA